MRREWTSGYGSSGGVRGPVCGGAEWPGGGVGVVFVMHAWWWWWWWHVVTRWSRHAPIPYSCTLDVTPIGSLGGTGEVSELLIRGKGKCVLGPPEVIVDKSVVWYFLMSVLQSFGLGVIYRMGYIRIFTALVEKWEVYIILGHYLYIHFAVNYSFGIHSNLKFYPRPLSWGQQPLKNVIRMHQWVFQ